MSQNHLSESFRVSRCWFNQLVLIIFDSSYHTSKPVDPHCSSHPVDPPGRGANPGQPPTSTHPSTSLLHGRWVVPRIGGGWEIAGLVVANIAIENGHCSKKSYETCGGFPYVFSQVDIFSEDILALSWQFLSASAGGLDLAALGLEFLFSWIPRKMNWNLDFPVCAEAVCTAAAVQRECPARAGDWKCALRRHPKFHSPCRVDCPKLLNHREFEVACSCSRTIPTNVRQSS